MANSYWRWKDANCNGENIEWISMTKLEFREFLKTEESHNRYFIRLGREVCNDADIIFLEATYEQYRDWYLELQHHFYLLRNNPGYSELSLDYFDEDEDLSMHEIIAGIGLSPDDIAINNETKNLVWMAISCLNENRKQAILAKYFWYPGKSDKEISLLIGEDFDSFTKRKYRALRQLENFLKNECPIF